MPEALLTNILLFGRLLRAAGLDVHHGRMLDAVRALALAGVRSRTDVRATLCALLVHRHEDLARFDEAFDLFWRARGAASGGRALYSLGERPRVVVNPAAGTPVRLDVDEPPPSRAQPARMAVGAYSATEISRTNDFAAFTPEELEQARRLVARLPWQLGTRRTRRWAPAAHGAIDLRPILRRNLTRGELIVVPRRTRRKRARPVVIIGDVSGSMERYSRVLLHFAHGLTRGAGRVESFVFATRLTRLTPRMIRGSKDPRLRVPRGTQPSVAAGLQTREGSLESLTRDVRDWGGGTRIGQALRTFNTRWARRVMRNGPIVLIVSDGWDRGDPALLARELARVRRSCRRLIWLNPLLGSASYEPLTRGMQAALHYVDDFLPVHNLVSLESLARHLRDLP